ncbi:MAG: hypothetical protein ACJAZM_001812, partial [Cyclobacteriaceae bacterium]
MKSYSKQLLLSLFLIFIGFLGYSQNALHFNGDGTDEVTITQTTITSLEGTGNFTFEAWVKPETFANFPTIFMANNSFNFSINTSGNPYLFVSGSGLYTSSGVLSTNTWAHVAVTSDGTNVVFYIDGVAAGSTAATFTLAAGGASYGIGQNIDGDANPFIGTIDELRVWTVARSATEIQDNYKTEIAT